MGAVTWWFWVLVVVVLVGLYLSQMAGRLDRLHIRVDRARSALDEQLLRRSAASLELATSGLLDPALSIVLGEAAHRARAADPQGRRAAESDLTLALQATFDDPEHIAELRAEPAAAALVDELAGASRRVRLARQFLDDAVRSCARVREQRVVRWFRLAGSAPYPRTEAFVDDPPPALVGA
jgi:hypothetical protein